MLAALVRGIARLWAQRTPAAAPPPAPTPSPGMPPPAAAPAGASPRIKSEGASPLPLRYAQPVAPGHELAGRVVRAMQQQGYSIAAGEDVLNIVYVEDMDTNGNPIAEVPNTFDSVRMLLRVTAAAAPRIVGIWEATTQPGRYWTEHPMNAGGAARIAFGQYSSWIVGRYHDQEALIQDAPITVYRDPRRRYTRYGPAVTGMFGIHQHWGYDYPHDDLGRSSAGCLVGRRTDGHREFMALLKGDARYRANHAFRFPTAVMHASTVACFETHAAHAPQHEEPHPEERNAVTLAQTA